MVITSRLFDRRGSMNIFDVTRPLKRMFEVPDRVISETIRRSFTSSGKKAPSFQTLFCWTIVLGVSLLMVSGCGRYKEELENTKQQIEKLNSEVKGLTEQVARLNQEKSRLSDELKTLSDKNKRIQGELDDLNKARVTLSAENTDLKQKYSSAQQEIGALEREKTKLTQEVGELEKRVAELTPAPTPPAAAMPSEVGSSRAKHQKELSPCDQVIAFMKASEGIVRQHKGTERTKLLEQVRQQYAPRMKGAPEKAIKAAENWVKEGSKFWDQSGGDGVFSLLQLRNTVLEACGKSPDAAGLK
jgi:outer membrane murein-binding lipoprotein Lpp